MPLTKIDKQLYEEFAVLEGLSIPTHDYISFSPVATPTTGSQTITFKVGGSGGNTVATLVLTYSGGELASVAKS